jgi:hypothetical protein
MVVISFNFFRYFSFFTMHNALEIEQVAGIQAILKEPGRVNDYRDTPYACN